MFIGDRKFYYNIYLDRSTTDLRVDFNCVRLKIKKKNTRYGINICEFVEFFFKKSNRFKFAKL